ncbi:uncharacterized protein PpBr36_10620 [Pyricularia pennisetigena]|uniref:uncharacterized protein n=1 Tax=Pyricularia pennisetigena TaxID=1578925 RepID=UPI001153AB99|nr:uncharacterized protein PpBr36_10620 [Pyricularia pennisetigena]TLS21233.1 hypothetical protein PpBr36_10620 [Pyricularia pennisetigena]
MTSWPPATTPRGAPGPCARVRRIAAHAVLNVSGTALARLYTIPREAYRRVRLFVLEDPAGPDATASWRLVDQELGFNATLLGNGLVLGLNGPVPPRVEQGRNVAGVQLPIMLLNQSNNQCTKGLPRASLCQHTKARKTVSNMLRFNIQTQGDIAHAIPVRKVSCSDVGQPHYTQVTWKEGGIMPPQRHKVYGDTV